MKRLTDNPLFSSALLNSDLRALGMDWILFAGPTREDRTHAWDELRQSASDRIIEVAETDEPNVAAASFGGTQIEVQLRNPEMVEHLVRRAGSASLFIDITSLATHIWAPLIRACWHLGVPCTVLYVEPGDYTPSRNPTEGELFDLSERIAGISPLPGFASIRRVAEEEAIFIPLLGFEGTRLAFIVESVEPRLENIFPIIGVPGFRISYPFHTYLGNQSTLIDTGAWKNAHYSRANCPFSAFYCLEAIASARPNQFMRIAPIGTKPHGLGAVLFYLANPSTVEIVYDHPLKRSSRTKGTSNIFSYDIFSFRNYVLNSKASTI